jgi:hypothetical protein
MKRKFYNVTIKIKFETSINENPAAEIINSKDDRKKENMRLSTWKNLPDGRILKSDAIEGKNYLNEKQIKQLERTVSGYFDYIEDLIERENTFTMKNLIKV